MSIHPDVVSKLTLLLDKAGKESMLTCTKSICNILKEAGLL